MAAFQSIHLLKKEGEKEKTAPVHRLYSSATDSVIFFVISVGGETKEDERTPTRPVGGAPGSKSGRGHSSGRTVQRRAKDRRLVTLGLEGSQGSSRGGSSDNAGTEASECRSLHRSISFLLLLGGRRTACLIVVVEGRPSVRLCVKLTSISLLFVGRAQVYRWQRRGYTWWGGIEIRNISSTKIHPGRLGGCLIIDPGL